MRRRFRLYLAAGAVPAAAVSLLRGLTRAASAADALRCLCDGFFAAAAILLAIGGLLWVSAVGGTDGLGYSTRGLLRRRYGGERLSFAEYRRARAGRTPAAPQPLLLAGCAHLLLSILLLAACGMAGS